MRCCTPALARLNEQLQGGSGGTDSVFCLGRLAQHQTLSDLRVLDDGDIRSDQSRKMVVCDDYCVIDYKKQNKNDPVVFLQ